MWGGGDIKHDTDRNSIPQRYNNCFIVCIAKCIIYSVWMQKCQRAGEQWGTIIIKTKYLCKSIFPFVIFNKERFWALCGNLKDQETHS